MPYSEPEISNNPLFFFHVAGPNGSNFAIQQMVVNVPSNEMGQQDPIARDAAFQAFINAIDAMPGFMIQAAYKEADTILWCTVDSPPEE